MRALCQMRTQRAMCLRCELWQPMKCSISMFKLHAVRVSSCQGVSLWLFFGGPTVLAAASAVCLAPRKAASCMSQQCRACNCGQAVMLDTHYNYNK